MTPREREQTYEVLCILVDNLCADTSQMLYEEYSSSPHLSNHLHDSDVHARTNEKREKREKYEKNTKQTTTTKTTTAAVFFFVCLVILIIVTGTYRRRLGNRRLLLMPGIVAIGVTLNSGVVNCNRFEPPPLLRFKIGVVVDKAAGSGFDNVSNSMSSLMVVPMRTMPLVVLALLPEFELMAMADDEISLPTHVFN